MEIMKNIQEGKADFSKLNSKNVYLEESWLEGLNLVRWMTKLDHR